MIRQAIWWTVVLGVFAALLWVWASIPFASPELCLLLAAVGALLLPIMVVLRWNLRGVFVGSVFVLCSLLAVRRVGTALDPYFRGEDRPTYIGIICFDWMIGVAYGFLIYGIKRLVNRP